MSTHEPLHLVLGGTGKTGRRVADRLWSLGHRVRLGSRSQEPPFDWDAPETYRDVLDGVDVAYVAYSPDLSFPGAADHIGGLVAAARQAGVRRLVLLSGRGEPVTAESEQLVGESGLEWTVLRASWFFQNFSESFLLPDVLAGAIVLPAGDVAEPFVDADDIAACAVAAMTDDRHTGEVYELTGPRLLTFADAADELSRATGRAVRYVPVTGDEFAAGAIDAGVPADVAHAYAALFSSVLDGRNASTTGDVQRILGRAPRDFTPFALEVASTGLWGPPAEAVLPASSSAARRAV